MFQFVLFSLFVYSSHFFGSSYHVPGIMVSASRGAVVNTAVPGPIELCSLMRETAELTGTNMDLTGTDRIQDDKRYGSTSKCPGSPWTPVQS